MAASILLGLAVALLWTEITGVLPGGLIVPAYLALYANQPWRIAATLAAAFLAFGAYRLLSRWFLLFGRRRFVFMLFIGGLIGQAWLLLWPRLFSGPVDLRVIGWVIPGLLANNLVRQKPGPTLASLAGATALTVALASLLF
ncbi:MAG: poly-gamma-glutamate biosynthesis protein PgsC [Candidatus Aminicenantes bacterium]|nr:poly-gamma-glutamate biosynthesis protein PgsC [Candidatus Aminicenantes bacterium]